MRERHGISLCLMNPTLIKKTSEETREHHEEAAKKVKADMDALIEELSNRQSQPQ